eukprot:PhM_4_TR17644/c0_g1_i1/m.78315/K09512/DNAJB6; DnaJ homolog subfamily B member 6
MRRFVASTTFHTWKGTSTSSAPASSLFFRRSFSSSRRLLERSFYDVLGVKRDASQADIKAAYRKLALKWHPDMNPDNRDAAEKEFKCITEAYKCLSDANQRSRYDMTSSFGGGGGGHPSGGFGGQARGFNTTGGDVRPEDVFREVFGDRDMRRIVEEMERQMHRQKHAKDPNRPVENPFDSMDMNQPGHKGFAQAFRTATSGRTPGGGEWTQETVYTKDGRKMRYTYSSNDGGTTGGFGGGGAAQQRAPWERDPSGRGEGAPFGSLPYGFRMYRPSPTTLLLRRLTAFFLIGVLLTVVLPSFIKLLAVIVLLWLIFTLW